MSLAPVERAPSRVSGLQLRPSTVWEKQREKVAKANRRIKQKVEDLQHKLSTSLGKEYDAVFVEDLDVSGISVHWERSEQAGCCVAQVYHDVRVQQRPVRYSHCAGESAWNDERVR